MFSDGEEKARGVGSEESREEVSKCFGVSINDRTVEGVAVGNVGVSAAVSVVIVAVDVGVVATGEEGNFGDEVDDTERAKSGMK